MFDNDKPQSEFVDPKIGRHTVVALGNDHIVTSTKMVLSDHLKGEGYRILDFGTYDDTKIHYPMYGKRVAEAVIDGRVDVGIVICGIGIGILTATDKNEDIRAAMVGDVARAKYAKRKLDANVLSMGGVVLGRSSIFYIADAFLNEKYRSAEENKRLIEKIDNIAKPNPGQKDSEHFFGGEDKKWTGSVYHGWLEWDNKMSELEGFRKVNPQYKILTLDDPPFKEHGVLYANNFNLDDVYKVMEKAPTPEAGMKYIANTPGLADTYTILAVKRDILGETLINASVTLGHSDTFIAFEYHQCLEVNIMFDDVLMVLGKCETLGEKHSADPNTETRMFYTPKGTIIELYNDTLHHAPIQITRKSYKIIVTIIHGTSAVLPEDVKNLSPRVVKYGKFQIVHPSRKDEIKQDYQAGLSGDIIETTPLDE